MDSLAATKEEAVRHYLRLAAQEKNRHQPLLTDIIKDFQCVDTPKITTRRRLVENEIVEMLAGSGHELTPQEQTDLLAEFIEAAAPIGDSTVTVRQTNVPTTTASAGAHTPTVAGEQAARTSKHCKLLTADIRAVLQRNDHFGMLRLSQSWAHLGAVAFHRALEEEGINTPPPNVTQTAQGYISELPVQSLDYLNHTIRKQLTAWGNGRGVTNPRTSKLTVRFVRNLAKLTVSDGSRDDEDQNRILLGSTLRLAAFHDYAGMFPKDTHWVKVRLAFLNARTEEDFEAACAKAEKAATQLVQLHTWEKETTTPHHVATPDTPTQTPATRTGHKELYMRIANLSLEERKSLAETPLPPVPAGHCEYCRKKGHQERNCWSKRTCQAVAAGLHPN